VPVAAGGIEQRVQVVVPTTLPAGIYTLASVIGQPRIDDPTLRDVRVTNEIPFAIAPQITGIGPTGAATTTTFTAPIPISLGATSVVDLTLSVAPVVGLGQRVSLLFGDLEVAPEAAATGPVSSIRFVITNPQQKRYRVRVRVDGVDSPLIDWSQTPPVFLAPVVEVTP
jgi:hypothetical protein